MLSSLPWVASSHTRSDQYSHEGLGVLSADFWSSLCKSLLCNFRLLRPPLAPNSVPLPSWVPSPGCRLSPGGSGPSQGSSQLFSLSQASLSCAACHPMFENHRFMYLSGFLVVQVGKVNPVLVTPSWPKAEVHNWNVK